MSGSTFIGSGALQNVGGSNNTAIGTESSRSILAGGNNNTTLGYFSGRTITTGDNNTIIGYRGGVSIADQKIGLTLGNSNTLIGANAGHALNTGSNNIILDTSGFNTGDVSNRFIVHSNGTILMDGDFATGILTATSGINVVSGYYISSTLTLSRNADNISIGTPGFLGLVGGFQNTCFGDMAGQLISSGQRNVLIGHSAGSSINIGGANQCLGAFAGDGITSGSFNVCIGDFADVPNPVATDQLDIRGQAPYIGGLMFGTKRLNPSVFADVDLGSSALPWRSLYLETSGGIPTPLNYYEEYTTAYLIDEVGVSSAPLGTMINLTFIRVGRMVTLHWDESIFITIANLQINGISSLPARFKPLYQTIATTSNETNFKIQVYNNSALATGTLTIYGAGNIGLIWRLGETGGFTNAVQCGIIPSGVSYTI